jgi:hypothetical protein
MPPHTRSQRRRPAARPQNRPAVSAETPEVVPSVGTTTSLEMPAPAARPARANRRVLSRAAPEPVDYTADYDAARRDLRWIALWTVILFAVMIALRFSGLV